MSPVSTLSARRTTPRVALVAGLILTVAGPVAALPSDTRQPAPWNDRPAHTAAVRDPAAAPTPRASSSPTTASDPTPPSCTSADRAARWPWSRPA